MVHTTRAAVHAIGLVGAPRIRQWLASIQPERIIERMRRSWSGPPAILPRIHRDLLVSEIKHNITSFGRPYANQIVGGHYF